MDTTNAIERNEAIDGLQMAVMGFIGRSDVAAVEMGIDELLDGHPLCDVWTSLLSARDICCVADLFGLETCDLTAIRGIGPAAVADIIAAIEAKRPWKFRLRDGHVDVEAGEVSDAEDEEAEEASEGDRDDAPLRDIIDNEALADALERAGLATIGDLLALDMGAIREIEGIGDDGAETIAAAVDGIALERELACGERSALVGDLVRTRYERDMAQLEQALEDGMAQLEQVLDSEADVEKTVGRPSMSDAEYDALTRRLDSDASEVHPTPGKVDAEAGPQDDGSHLETQTSPVSAPEVEPVAAAPDVPGFATSPIDPAAPIESGTPKTEMVTETAAEQAPAGSLTRVLANVHHGELLADLLAEGGMTCADDLMGMSVAELAAIEGVGMGGANRIREALKQCGYAGYVREARVETNPAQSPEPLSSLAPTPAWVPQAEVAASLAATPVSRPESPAAAVTPEPQVARDRVDPFAPVPMSPSPSDTAVLPPVEARDPYAPAAAGHTVAFEPVEQPRGTWTPDGFVADDADDEGGVDSTDDEEEEVAQTEITSYRARPDFRRIALFGGIGLVAVGAALAAGIALGGGIAHADVLTNLVQVI